MSKEKVKSGERVNLSEYLKREKTSGNMFFVPLLTGSYSLHQITSTYDPNEIDYSGEVQLLIEQRWQEVLANNPNATSGPLVSLRSFKVTNGGNLELGLGYTNYRDYRGTVALSTEARERNGYNLSHPFAAVMMVYSPKACQGNGGILAARRSATAVIHHPRALEFPGGNVDQTDLDQNGKINPITTALRELQQEQGVTHEMLSEGSLHLTSIVYEQYQDAAPTAIVTAELSDQVDPEDVFSLEKDGEGESLWIPARNPQLIEMTLKYSLMSLPIVLAGVYSRLVSQGETTKADWFQSRIQRRGGFYGRMNSMQIADLESRKVARFKAD